MHEEVLSELKYDHGVPPEARGSERRTWAVVALTAVMMVAEIGVGLWSGSKALEGDGWHMGTHAGAIGLAGLAYWFARTQSDERRFSFGTGKVYALAAWTNAILLLLAAVWLIGASILRLVSPVDIRFEEALPVAVLGLLVNLVSAWLLHPGDGQGGSDDVSTETGHRHGPLDHGHDHGHHHHAHDHGDLNRRSAYLHVLMDLLTSVTAIVALAAGWWLDLGVLDPVMGIVGGAVILRWGVKLLRDAAGELLDAVPEDRALERVRARLEAIDDVVVADLHLWTLGFGRRACVVSLVTENPRSPGHYRAAVLEVEAIDHLTVEVNRCPHPCEAA